MLVLQWQQHDKTLQVASRFHEIVARFCQETLRAKQVPMILGVVPKYLEQYCSG